MPRSPVDETRRKLRLVEGRGPSHGPSSPLEGDEKAKLGRCPTAQFHSIVHSTTMARYARRPSSGPTNRGPWKHGAIPVIGLVGGIGAGKSLVAARLAELGAHVLDADAIGHALLDQTPARDQVLKRFGPEILDRSGTGTDEAPARIDRRALGAIVFADPKLLKDLETILHPRMRRTFERAIERDIRNKKVPAVVLDAAVLFEAGWNALCDSVVFVDAPREQRLARLSADRGWNPEALDVRERAQKPLEAKRQQADHVLVNDADPEALREEVSRLWQTLVKPSRAAASKSPRRASAPRNRPTSKR